MLPALLLMFLPIQWVSAVIVAAAVHELSHIAALCLLDVHVFDISIGLRGARILTEPMNPTKELVCALAGPLGSAALLLTARWFPRLAICGAVHCLYNCLPLLPFDGGRVLHSAIALVFPEEYCEQVWKHTQHAVQFAIALFTALLAFKLGWGVLLLGILILRYSRRKTSCQQTLLAIQ